MARGRKGRGREEERESEREREREHPSIALHVHCPLLQCSHHRIACPLSIASMLAILPCLDTVYATDFKKRGVLIECLCMCVCVGRHVGTYLSRYVAGMEAGR